MSNLTSHEIAAAAFAPPSKRWWPSFPGYESREAIPDTVQERGTSDSPVGGLRLAEPGILAGLEYGAFTREQTKVVTDGIWSIAGAAIGDDQFGKAAAGSVALLSSAKDAYAQLHDPDRTGMEKTGAVIGAAGDVLAFAEAAFPQVAAVPFFQFAKNTVKLLGMGCKIYVAPEPDPLLVTYRALKPSP